MYKNTQNIINQIDFNKILLHLIINSRLETSPRINLRHVFFILSLSTGIKIEDLLSLKWKNLVVLGSENEAVVKNELELRKYVIPIHPQLKLLITKSYSYYLFPKLDSLVIQSDESTSHPNKARVVKRIVRYSLQTIKQYLKLSIEYEILEPKYDVLTQILFGRKVFEVNGYTNEISKKLKQHFDIRTNKEIFDFLGYISKDEIKYQLSHINLDSSNLIARLEDKNFNTNFPIQKFTAFSKFLINRNKNNSLVTDSIAVLLLISLYNGVRPSLLLKLKWKDVAQFDDNNNLMEIWESVVLGKHIIFLNQEIKKNLLSIFNHLYNYGFDEITFETVKIKTQASSDDYLFRMNSGKPITQPSLLREMKNALRAINFPHANKITTKSTLIMFGRRIIEIKGDHKPTIKRLIEHYNFRSKKQLFDFLYIDYKVEKNPFSFKGKVRKTIFEEILYDL